MVPQVHNETKERNHFILSPVVLDVQQNIRTTSPIFFYSILYFYIKKGTILSLKTTIDSLQECVGI